MSFAYPYLLFLFIFVFYFIYEYFFTKKNESKIKFSSLEIIGQIQKKEGFLKRENIISILKLITLSLLILAIARPQLENTTEEITTKGYQIIIALDTSSSMLAEDFKPNNRLFVAKNVVANFIKKRGYDQIGLIVFAQIAFTQSPLTTDHESLLNFLDKIEVGITKKDGTALGNAIAASVARLKDSSAKSKIAILVTDGANNAGQIDPLTASQAAASLGVKIYTIGIGSTGLIPYPVDDPVFGRRYVNVKSDLDEKMLENIAKITDAQYFRATDKKSLEKIYEVINNLEKSDIKIKEHKEYKELFFYFLIPAIILFILKLLLTTIIWIKLP